MSDDLTTRLREHAENCAGRYDVTGYTILREAADALDAARVTEEYTTHECSVCGDVHLPKAIAEETVHA